MKKNKILLSTIIVLAFSSCQKQGCTDEAAVNYDAEAKKNAGCIYERIIKVPESIDEEDVEIRIVPIANGKRFYFSEVYEDDQKRKMQISRFKYFVSNVQLAGDGLEKAHLTKIDLVDYDTSKPLSPVVPVFDHVVAGKVAAGSYKRILFGCGVDAALNEEYRPNDYPSDHPLNATYTNMDCTWEAKYKFASIEGNVDSDNDNTPEKAFFMHTGFNDLYRQVLLTPGDFEVKEGMTTYINLELDIVKVFEGLDIATKEGQTHTSGDEQKGYSAIIQTNLANHIKFVNVTYQ